MNSNAFNRQRLLDAQALNDRGMYYPYRTEVSDNRAQFQPQNSGFGTYTTSNRFDPSSSVGPLAPYYLNKNSQYTRGDRGDEEKQVDNNPYSTNKYNPINPFYNQTQMNGFGASVGLGSSNDNLRFNPSTHLDVHQYDGLILQ